MEKNSYVPIAEGVLRGVMLTTVLFLVFAGIMTFKEVSEGATSAFYTVTMALSIIYAAIYSVKKIKSRGWLVGLIVAFLYMLVIYLVSMLSHNTGAMNSARLVRFLLALGVGTLSGMLGINL